MSKSKQVKRGKVRYVISLMVSVFEQSACVGPVGLGVVHNDGLALVSVKCAGVFVHLVPATSAEEFV